MHYGKSKFREDTKYSDLFQKANSHQDSSSNLCGLSDSEPEIMVHSRNSELERS